MARFKTFKKPTTFYIVSGIDEKALAYLELHDDFIGLCINTEYEIETDGFISIISPKRFKQRFTPTEACGLYSYECIKVTNCIGNIDVFIQTKHDGLVDADLTTNDYLSEQVEAMYGGVITIESAEKIEVINYTDNDDN